MPGDLLNLCKLIQVLAATLADDGCLPLETRAILVRLASFLDDALLRPRVLQTAEEYASPCAAEVEVILRLLDQLPDYRDDVDLLLTRRSRRKCGVSLKGV